MAVIYPEGLTQELQVALGAALLLVNVAIYAVVLRCLFRRRSLA